MLLTKHLYVLGQLICSSILILGRLDILYCAWLPTNAVKFCNVTKFSQYWVNTPPIYTPLNLPNIGPFQVDTTYKSGWNQRALMAQMLDAATSLSSHCCIHECKAGLQSFPRPITSWYHHMDVVSCGINASVYF